MADEIEEVTEENVDDTFNQAVAATDPDPAPEPAETPTEPAPEPEPTPEPSPEPDPGIADLLKQYQEAGIPLSEVSSEADLARAALQQMQQMQPWVRMAQQQQYQQPKPEPEPEPPTDQWDAQKYFQDQYGGPTWKPEFDQLIETGAVQIDDNGRYVAAPGAEMLASPHLAALNQASQHSQKFWREMGKSNPLERIYGAVKEPLLREIDSRVQEILQSRETETRARSAVDKFVDENADWMYQTNPSTGELVPTEKGQQFLDRYNRLRERGIANPADLLEEAMYGFEIPEAKAPEPAAQEQEKKDTFLESAQRRAAHSPSSRERGDAPQVMDQPDLDNVFLRAYRESKTA